MLTNPRRIGFLGLDSYDVIIFLARFLTSLGEKVLIKDYSQLGGLSYCIPTPVSLNPEKEVISFRDIDYIKSESNLNLEEEYSFILIDFGLHTKHETIKQCENLYLLTDLQQHNIDYFLNMEVSDISVYFLLKNYFNASNIKSFREYLNEKEFIVKNCYMYPSSERDLENKVLLQYSGDMKWKSLTKQMKELLYSILIETLSFSEKEVVKSKKW